MVQCQKHGCAVSGQRALTLPASKCWGEASRSRVWLCIPSFWQPASWGLFKPEVSIWHLCLVAHEELILHLLFDTIGVSILCSILQQGVPKPCACMEPCFWALHSVPDTCLFYCMPPSCSGAVTSPCLFTTSIPLDFLLPWFYCHLFLPLKKSHFFLEQKLLHTPASPNCWLETFTEFPPCIEK